MSRDSAIHPCPDFLVDFSDFVDGTLPPSRRSQIEVHLDCCEGCLRHLAAYRRGVEAYRDIPFYQADPDEFWLGLRIRLASDKEPAESPSPRGSGWRMPAMAGAAVAVLALSVIWVGTRIDNGLQRVAETARQPVAAAGASVSEGLVGDGVVGEGIVGGDPATVDPASEAAKTVRPTGRPTPTIQLASASGRSIDREVDPALQREFESLREEIETAAWLGDPYLASSTRSFDSGGLGQARVRTVDYRTSEPVPVTWSY